MKKILVFGATGGTGREVVQQALERGYEVTAVARNPSAFSIRHPFLYVVYGDVLDPSTLELAGMDAVISCLGTNGSLKPTTLYSEGVSHIMSAMERAGVRRLVCISAGALYTNKEMGLFIRFVAGAVLQRILRRLYKDMRIMEKMVERSNLDWTIVRPPRLTDRRLTRRYRIGVNRHLKRPFRIGRADLAHYMLDSIDAPETAGAKVEVAY